MKLKRSALKVGSMQTVVFIGEKLKDLRLRRAMSQRKLAEAAGMSQRAIVDLETDRREPRPSTLGKLAEALGVEPSKFFED
jgi:transcriptional regulator with XRE-family HTH domain